MNLAMAIMARGYAIIRTRRYYLLKFYFSECSSGFRKGSLQ